MYPTEPPPRSKIQIDRLLSTVTVPSKTEPILRVVLYLYSWKNVRAFS